MKKTLEDIKKMFSSRTSFNILFSLGVIMVILLVFSAGVSVGFHKASFGRNWGENYERNFGMFPGKTPLGGMGRDDNMPNPHGVIGKIIKIELPRIIVQDKDGTEKVVTLKEDTQIQRMKEKMEARELKIDNFVVIIGSPNEEGQIEAKLIRIIPSPELMPMFKK